MIEKALSLQCCNKQSMKYSEIHRKLKRAGCYQVGANRHPKWFSPMTGKTFDTSHHESEEAATGTLRKISKLSGVEFK